MATLGGIITAMGLGALHSLEPGHGKSIMGAYLAVSRTTFKDILLMGATAAMTHTAVVLALAFILHAAVSTVYTHSQIPEAGFEKYLKLFSGLIIMFIGLLMLRRITGRKEQACHCPAHRRPKLATGPLLIGISNGLIPCPSSVTVILMSLNSGTMWSGLLVVAAFGIGGAISLVAVGLLFSRISSLAGFSSGGRISRAIALASSLLIMGIGFFTAFGALL